MHSDTMKRIMESEGIVLIGYRDLRDALRK